jgi:hypothetical protein
MDASTNLSRLTLKNIAIHFCRVDSFFTGYWPRTNRSRQSLDRV